MLIMNNVRKHFCADIITKALISIFYCPYLNKKSLAQFKRKDFFYDYHSITQVYRVIYYLLRFCNNHSVHERQSCIGQLEC